MAKWLIVRHGETAWNRDGRVQGQADTPLSEEGRAQARALGAALAEVSIDRLFCSDLSRARETAALVLAGREVPSKFTAELRELNFGDWEGRLGEELAREDPVRFKKWHTGSPDFSAPGGESVRQLLDRTRKYVAGIRESAREGNSLIVAHGGTVRALLNVMLGIPPVVVGRFTVSRAGLTILEVGPEGSVLLVYNDVSHYRSHLR